MSDSSVVLYKSIPDMHLSLHACVCFLEFARLLVSAFLHFLPAQKKKSSTSLQETALCNTFGAAALMLRLDKKYQMHEEVGREGTGVFLYDIEEATAVR